MLKMFVEVASAFVVVGMVVVQSGNHIAAAVACSIAVATDEFAVANGNSLPVVVHSPQA